MKKKLLYIHHRLGCGGAEQALYDQICLLDKEKFDITVFVVYTGGEWDQKFRDAGIKVVDVWAGQKVSGNPLVKLGNLIKRARIRHSMKHKFANAINICFPGEFDLVVSNSAGVRPELDKARGAKVIKYIHGNVETNPEYREGLESYGADIRRFDRYICVSEESRQAFCRMTGLDKQVVTCYNPLNSANVRTLAQVPNPLPTDAPVLCAVGRLAAEKAYDRLIRIHREILDAGVFHRLVIVGDGPERETLERCIEKTDTAATVTLAGYTINPYPYIKHCSFMVCSSYTEGLPVIAMEALCLGTPIVSAVPSVGELFAEDCCGLITENDDDSLKNGILKMLTDREFYDRVKAGAAKASCRFDGREMVKKIEQLYQEVLES